MRPIPYGRQDISQKDIDAVVEVLRSDWLTQGPAIERFEDSLTTYCGVKHAIAVNSATAALHLSCIALGLGRGDRLWTVPNTFVASANCGLYCGAEVDFVDIDSRTYNMDPEALRAKLILARQAGTLPKVVVPVHFAGQSCDMAAIRALSREFGFSVIEDASHAVGARYQGRPVGNCQYSDLAVFSFHPVKIVTTGEGGVVLTNDDRLAEFARMLRSHGITRNPTQMEGKPPGGWYYEQHALGYNYRMTDMQAALGASQMYRLDAFIGRRRELVARYDRLLTGLRLILPYQDPVAESSWHLYVIQTRSSKDGRAEVFCRMREAGILVNVHYIPVHMQPYYRRLGFAEGQFPVAESYYASAISLPLFPTLTEQQQDHVVGTLRAVL